MIGKHQIQITGAQFSAGLATSDYLGDGGLGTSSANLTLIQTPGVIRATPSFAMTNSIPASENIIASCEDGSGVYNQIVVTDGGSFATVGNTTFNTFARTSPFSNYTAGITDMVYYAGFAWATRTTDLVQYTVSGGATDPTWWTVTKGKSALTATARHPLLVFEGYLWIGDKNLLHNTDGSTANVSVLTLATNERITALGIDPGTGLMMIGIRTLYDANDQLAAANYIYLYDGISAKPRRKIAVDAPVWGFHNVGGQVFVGVGNTVGVWNGAGVTFLRRLSNTTSAAGSVPTKQRMTHFENTFMVVDNNNTILCYGDIQNGKKAWWPMYATAAGAKNISLIANLGNDTSSSIPQSPWILATGGTQVAVVVAPMDAVTVGSGVFYTNNINFERPVIIRGARVFTTGITTTAGIGEVAFVNENQATYTPTVKKFVVLSAASPRYVFDFTFEQKVQTLQPKITLDTQAFGIYKVIIYYDVVE